MEPIDSTPADLLAMARAVRSQLQELADEAERQQAGGKAEGLIWRSFCYLGDAIDELELPLSARGANGSR